MAATVRNPKDFYSGLLFMAFGLAAVVIGRDYPMGTAVRMGPGYFPTILGSILLFMGVVLAIRGLITRGESIGRVALKALVLVLGAVSLFAGVVDWLGLVIAVTIVVVVGSFANPQFKPWEVVLLLVVMLALSVGLFAKALGLPFKLWPGA